MKKRLRNRTYRPGGLRKVRIPKMDGGVRTLHIPNVDDRVVARAVTLVLVAVYEFVFSSFSFGFRVGLCTAHALATLDRICTQEDRWMVCKVDIRDAYGHVPHGRLLDIIRIWIKDADLVNLIELFIRRVGWENREGKTHIGLPQGDPLAPVLFNIYLDHLLDKVLERHCIRFIRWADDLILICRDERELNEHLALVTKLLRAAGMSINEKKLRIADLRRGDTINYLGYTVKRNKSGQLEYDLTDEAYLSLVNQLRMDLAGQDPNVGWNGYRSFINDTILFTIGSWLEAYAGAIPEHLWPETRREIKALFLGDPVWLLEGINAVPRLFKAITCPSSDSLNTLYIRARLHWDTRYTAPIPNAYTRLLGSQRDAQAQHHIRTEVPEFIASGADLVPAPLAIVEAGPRPGSPFVDFRVKLAPFEPDGSTPQAEGADHENEDR